MNFRLLLLAPFLLMTFANFHEIDVSGEWVANNSKRWSVSQRGESVYLIREDKLCRLAGKFNDDNGPELVGSFLIALHGSTNKRIARGYRVIRSPTPGSKPDDFITGFLDRGIVNGRPADIFAMGRDSFLVTDDRAGVVYYVFKPRK